MKNIVRSDIYRSEKEFAVGRLGSVIGSTLISGIIVTFTASILGNIFGSDSSIVDFIRTTLTSIFAGALAVEVLFAYREDRAIRVSGFFTVLSENIASFLLVAIGMGVINFALGLVTSILGSAFLANPGLAGMISIIMMIVSIYISCATAFKYYLIKDKDMGIEAIAESFKMSRDVIFDIIAVTVRYMWIPFVALIITVISAFSFIMPVIMYGDFDSFSGGSFGLFLIFFIITIILFMYYGARLVIANGILYSQVAGDDFSDDNIVGTAEEVVVEEVVVEEVEVEVEVVEPEVVESEDIKPESL